MFPTIDLRVDIASCMHDNLVQYQCAIGLICHDVARKCANVPSTVDHVDVGNDKRGLGRSS